MGGGDVRGKEGGKVGCDRRNVRGKEGARGRVERMRKRMKV